MVHNRRWFVPQLLPRGEQPTTELSIFVTNFVARSGAQVRPKPFILREHSLLESHVRAKGSLCQRPGFKAEVKNSERRQCTVPRVWQPPRRRAVPHGKDAAPAASPLSLEQGCRKLLQPYWFDCYVVVHECDYVALGFRNPTVKRVRFPWLRFKQITKAAGVSATEVRDHLTRPIVRTVVNH